MARKSGTVVGVSLENVRKFALAARATEDTRPLLTCGYAQGESLATADGFRLHVAVFADESARKRCEAGENAWGLIGLDDSSRKAAQDGGRFPDFNAIIPRWRDGNYVRLSVRREELIALVKTALVFARDNNDSVRFGWDSDSRILTVTGRSLEYGDVSSAMPALADCAYSARRELVWAANGEYMIGTLRGMDSEFITLAVESGSKPIILDDTVQTEAGAVELFTLIMPMSVDKSVPYNGPVTDTSRDLADDARALCDVDNHTFEARGKSKVKPLPSTTPLIAMLNKSTKFYEDGAKTLRLIVRVETGAALGEQSTITADPPPAMVSRKALEARAFARGMARARAVEKAYQFAKRADVLLVSDPDENKRLLRAARAQYKRANRLDSWRGRLLAKLRDQDEQTAWQAVVMAWDEGTVKYTAADQPAPIVAQADKPADVCEAAPTINPDTLADSDDQLFDRLYGIHAVLGRLAYLNADAYTLVHHMGVTDLSVALDHLEKRYDAAKVRERETFERCKAINPDRALEVANVGFAHGNTMDQKAARALIWKRYDAITARENVPQPINPDTLAESPDANKPADVRPGRHYARKLHGARKSARSVWRIVPSVPSVPSIEAPTIPAADPEPEPIKANTFAESINALTFDDLCALLADKLASAAIGRVNARLVEVGRELRAAQAHLIRSIEAAQPSAQPAPVQAPSLPMVEDIPLVCEWDKGENVSSESINADTFGPDWSEWGGFWETPPTPDLDDTQPMPAVEPDDDPDPDPDPEAGRGIDYTARMQAAGRVIGRFNARITVLDEDKRRWKGKSAERAHLLHYAEMAHNARARYQVAAGRPVQIFDHVVADAAGPSYDAEYARLTARPVVPQTENAAQNAISIDGVGGPAQGDKPADVQPINPHTLDELVKTAVGEGRSAAGYRRDLATADRAARTSDGARLRVEVLKENLNAREGAYARLLSEMPSNLTDGVREYVMLCNDADDRARACNAWADRIMAGLRGLIEAPDYACDYRLFAQECRLLYADCARADNARQALVGLGVTDDDAVIWRPLFALEVIACTLRSARREINKTAKLRLRADRIEQWASAENH